MASTSKQDKLKDSIADILQSAAAIQRGHGGGGDVGNGDQQPEVDGLDAVQH
jgi:hypothetical protein